MNYRGFTGKRYKMKGMQRLGPHPSHRQNTTFSHQELWHLYCPQTNPWCLRNDRFRADKYDIADQACYHRVIRGKTAFLHDLKEASWHFINCMVMHVNTHQWLPVCSKVALPKSSYSCTRLQSTHILETFPHYRRPWTWIFTFFIIPILEKIKPIPLTAHEE